MDLRLSGARISSDSKSGTKESMLFSASSSSGMDNTNSENIDDSNGTDNIDNGMDNEVFTHELFDQKVSDQENKSRKISGFKPSIEHNRRRKKLRAR